jgi:hypothetical protein
LLLRRLLTAARIDQQTADHGGGEKEPDAFAEPSATPSRRET